MPDSADFSVTIAVYPEASEGTSGPPTMLTQKPIAVPAGRGLTVGRPRLVTDSWWDHVAISQAHVTGLPLGSIPERVLSLMTVELPGGECAVTAFLSASNRDYWNAVAGGQRTGPDVWHRVFNEDTVTILRRDDTREEWRVFLQAKILSNGLLNPERPGGSGTLLVEKAQLEHQARKMAGNLRRDLFHGDVEQWQPWAFVFAATCFLIRANRTQGLLDRLNAALDSLNPEMQSAALNLRGQGPRNTQFRRPQDAFRILRRRYENLVPAELEGLPFEHLLGVKEPVDNTDDARSLFYSQLLKAQILTNRELSIVAPILGRSEEK